MTIFIKNISNIQNFQKSKKYLGKHGYFNMFGVLKQRYLYLKKVALCIEHSYIHFVHAKILTMHVFDVENYLVNKHSSFRFGLPTFPFGLCI